ncbi:suppressor of tub2 mutation [Coemansia sp. RSA 1813]|nr:suppressor of tub2 mutation [Coemansia sp. RSA 1843]KAJ2215167.1 suppressor of tub2 mutation [Coemansia sp. RSA 487]KAJ2572267.1 suppressor of tub2 mutation [Coemansia sp. RSA 1813]
MPETLDQLLRLLQGAQSLGVEKRSGVLERLRESLEHGDVTGSAKALEGIITTLASILGSSQVIACQAALGCIQPLVDYIARDSNAQIIKALMHFIPPQLLDRLGDGRMAVRELALSTLATMWASLNRIQNTGQPLVASQSPTRIKAPNRQSGIGSSIPRAGTPLWSRATRPTAPISPSASNWNSASLLERDIQTRGFGHKTWRVREMVLEWLITCVQQYPDFPAIRYIGNIFAHLDDNQDAVRFAAKRALNTIYHAHTELQEDIIAKAQAITPHRPALLSAITAPPGEFSSMPSSPYGGMRSSSRIGSAMGMRPGSRISGFRADSRIVQPSFLPQIPGTGGMHGGSRCISQQGYRPGSRIGGYSSPLSPSRAIQSHTSPLHMHSAGPPLPSNGDLSLSPANLGPPPMHLPNMTSSLSNRHASNIPAARRTIQRQPSNTRIADIFTPGKDVPAGVKVHNVPSRNSLAIEFSRTIGCFAGRETEENWIQREKAICLYRGIVWGNAGTEFYDELASLLKEYIHDLFKGVESLRTSLSSQAMGLCEDIAIRLGPYASTIFDVIVDALLRQCAQTKKIGAQRASKSLEVVFQHFPLRLKGIDTLKQRMSDKSATLRQAIVSTCCAVLCSQRTLLGSSDRRSADILTAIGVIVKGGVSDSQPSVREASRELFWELHMTSALHAKKVLAGFPDSVHAALDRDKARYVRNDQCGSLPHQARRDSKPMSEASGLRPASRSYGRQPPLRPSFSSSRESIAPSLMSVVSGGSPQRSVSSDRLTSTHSTPINTQQAMSSMEPDNLDERDETEPMFTTSTLDEVNVEEDESIIFAEPTKPHLPHGHIRGLETPVKARMSLGLIDFSQMDVDTSLADINTPPRRVPTGEIPQQARNPKEEPVVDTMNSHGIVNDAYGESQATVVTADPVVDEIASQMSSLPLQADHKDGSDMSIDEPPSHTTKGEPSLDQMSARCLPAKTQTITPEHSPGMSPQMQPRSGNMMYTNSSATQNAYQQMVTPRTQAARYWHGPMEPAMMGALNRQPVIESPMPADTPQRLTKIGVYLSRLEANHDVDESLFRSLARFAKEESSGVWPDEDNGGRGYLGRILKACLQWLQNPVENRDTVFTKDSCFDVLRVLVRRKSQYFNLENSRILLLEVLRNRFFESTILSGSAEDVFYDITTHLDIDLCFELAEDFFMRAPLPPTQELATQKSGYVARLEPLIPTPAEMDPMGVYKMDNALAGMLEFSAEVVRRLPPSSIITEQELDRFMPFSMACFIHPRTQVRKAALAPLIAVHEKLGLPDTELETVLLHARPEELASSTNPLAKYVSSLHRPELRRLAWTFYLSQKSA